MANSLLDTLNNKDLLDTLNTDEENKDQVETTDGVIDKATVDPTLTVANQMTGLLSSESPYLNVARSNAARTANQRGLLNSSIAAGSGEKAAIESALPIAQQDAEYLQGSAGKTQEARLQTGLYQTQGDISKEISALEAEQKSKLSEQEAGQARELEGIVQEGANYRQQMELDSEKTLATMELGANEKQSYASAVANYGDAFMEELNNIQRDPNVTAAAKTAAIQTLQEAYRQNLETLASIYNVEITWEDLGGYNTNTNLIPATTPRTETITTTEPTKNYFAGQG